jgi:hypoxanthine phosphoribosyltransferase
VSHSRPRVLFTAEQIQGKVQELAAAIDARYAGSEDLVLVGVLRGAIYFLTDLSRALATPHRIDFVEYASYRGTTKGAGRLIKDCSDPIDNADVLLVDEILDTGETLAALCAHLAACNPRSLRICALFVRATSPGLEGLGEFQLAGPEGASGENLPPDIISGHPIAPARRFGPSFHGFSVGPEFLVGYGLDHKQHMRHLPHVGVVEE